MLNDVLSSGALPALEATMRFAGHRNRVLMHNVSNISTPEFQQKEVSPQDFQRWLSQALDKRREQNGGTHGGLDFKSDRQFVQRKDGSFSIKPLTSSGGVLAHDRNNRDVEKLMHDLAENLAAYQVATDLMRSHMGILRTAITERA